MTPSRSSARAAVLALGLAVPCSGVSAQRPAVSVGVGGGVVAAPVSGRDPRGASPHALFTVGVAPARGPLELRADVLWLLGNSHAGSVSLSASALAPLGSLELGGVGRLRPYVIGGAGVYGIGGVGRVAGGNAGAGARLERARLAVFAETRHHTAYGSTFGTLGVALRR